MSDSQVTPRCYGDHPVNAADYAERSCYDCPSENACHETSVFRRTAPKRVAFIGSHSTGKTTVARPMAEALGVPFLSEVAREVAREWGYTPAKIPDRLVLAYQWRILRDQILREGRHPAFVSDRSTLDNAAYFLAYAAQSSTAAGIEDYLNRAAGNMVNYDQLILIPPMFAPVDDGERHTDPAEQARIHELVVSLINGWSLGDKVYTVTSATPEARLAEILEVLGA